MNKNMKMAVVGCEASGKTVFMCALADYYGRDAANNPMRLKLTPENAAANSFERLQFRQMRCLRLWPDATSASQMVDMKWSLRYQGQAMATIELPEFGGELFRKAFCDQNGKVTRSDSVNGLLKYLSEADFFVVLVSIKALLSNPTVVNGRDLDRESESLWATRSILDYIRTRRPNAGVVIGLTHADRYRNQLGNAGGAKQLFAARWPTVAAAAEGIPVVEVASVSGLDDFGYPAEGYHSRGILPVMNVFAKHCFGHESALENGAFQLATKAAEPAPRSNRGLITTIVSTVAACALAVVTVCLLIKANAPDAATKIIERTITNNVETVVEKVVEKRVEVPVTNVVEKLVPSATHTIERIIEVPVTNTVEKIIEMIVEVPVTNTVESAVEKIIEVPVTNNVETIVEKIIEVPVTNNIEMVVEVPVTNNVETIVEKIVEVPVTNNIETVVMVPVTNNVETIVEKVIEVPVTNIVEKIVENFIEVEITNTVENIIEVPITNTVERIVEKRVEVPVTNTVERIIEQLVEKRVEVPVTNTVERIIEQLVEKRVEVPVTNTVEKIVDKVVEKRVEVPVTNTVERVIEKVVEKRVEVPVTNTVEKVVEKVVEKRVEVPVTNGTSQVIETVVEKRVEIPVTNTVETVVENTVEVPVTNIVEKIVEKRVEVPVVKVVEKRVEVPVTNVVEKVVEKVVERVITNVIERVIVKQEGSSGKATTNLQQKIVQQVVAEQPVQATTAKPPQTLSETDIQKQVPPGYRIWTDYNGRKIIARWTGIAVDESGITIVTRYNRRLDAVLWKFSDEDQKYIKDEIKRHRDLDEVMVEGKWIKNPLLKAK